MGGFLKSESREIRGAARVMKDDWASLLPGGLSFSGMKATAMRMDKFLQEFVCQKKTPCTHAMAKCAPTRKKAWPARARAWSPLGARRRVVRSRRSSESLAAEEVAGQGHLPAVAVDPLGQLVGQVAVRVLCVSRRVAVCVSARCC